MLILKQKKLYHADKTLPVPFVIKLNASNDLLCTQILRIKQRKQIVCYAIWEKKEVVAKLFYDKKNAKKEQQKDANGVKFLLKNAIKTPLLLFEGSAYKQRKLYILIYERLSPVQSLGSIIKKKGIVSETIQLIYQVVRGLAEQHSLGIIQRDLNLENFLVSNNQIYYIDGRLIEQVPVAVSQSIKFEYLAQFFIRLGRTVSESILVQLYKYYMENLFLPTDEKDFSLIRSEMSRLYDMYAARYLTRIYKQNTDFNRIVTFKTFVIYANDYTFSELQNLIDDPQKNFLMENDRRTSVHYQQKIFIIKKYPIEKGWRYLNLSKANKVWKFYNNRYIRQRSSVKPIAFIKKRQRGFKMTSYLILERL